MSSPLLPLHSSSSSTGSSQLTSHLPTFSLRSFLFPAFVFAVGVFVLLSVEEAIVYLPDTPHEPHTTHHASGTPILHYENTHPFSNEEGKVEQTATTSTSSTDAPPPPPPPPPAAPQVHPAPSVSAFLSFLETSLSVVGVSLPVTTSSPLPCSFSFHTSRLPPRTSHSPSMYYVTSETTPQATPVTQLLEWLAGVSLSYSPSSPPLPTTASSEPFYSYLFSPVFSTPGLSALGRFLGWEEGEQTMEDLNQQYGDGKYLFAYNDQKEYSKLKDEAKQALTRLGVDVTQPTPLAPVHGANKHEPTPSTPNGPPPPVPAYLIHRRVIELSPQQLYCSSWRQSHAEKRATSSTNENELVMTLRRKYCLSRVMRPVPVNYFTSPLSSQPLIISVLLDLLPPSTGPFASDPQDLFSELPPSVIEYVSRIESVVRSLIKSLKEVYEQSLPPLEIHFFIDSSSYTAQQAFEAQTAHASPHSVLANSLKQQHQAAFGKDAAATTMTPLQQSFTDTSMAIDRMIQSLKDEKVVHIQAHTHTSPAFALHHLIQSDIALLSFGLLSHLTYLLREGVSILPHFQRIKLHQERNGKWAAPPHGIYPLPSCRSQDTAHFAWSALEEKEDTTKLTTFFKSRKENKQDHLDELGISLKRVQYHRAAQWYITQKAMTDEKTSPNSPAQTALPSDVVAAAASGGIPVQFLHSLSTGDVANVADPILLRMCQAIPAPDWGK